MAFWRIGEHFKHECIMKKVIILFVSIITTSFGFISCQKEEVSNTNLNEKTVSFNAVSIETRTTFGTPSGTTYPTLWTNNDSEVKVSLNYASAKDAAVNPSEDFKSATFGGSFQDDKTGAYTFLALSPQSSYVSLSKEHSSWNVNIKTSQKPLSNSVDESTQILAAVSEEFSEFPDKVSLSFKHVTAYGKISFSNLSLPEGETVASVSLTAAENWAGRWYYYPATNTVEESSASQTITLETTSTRDIWFACAPVDLGGKTVDVIVTTNTGSTYKRTITIPAGKKFEAGKIASFTVNMAGVSPEGAVVYKRVDNVSDLTLNSEIIIVSSAENLALSTTQNTNNRASASVQKSTDGDGNAIIMSPGNDVQVLKIGNGSNGGTYSLSTGSGFLCAASSSNNYLRTEETLDANGSWAISINEGIATIVATGSYTRNHIRFNNPSFACYQTGSTTGTAVNIYKKSGTGSGTINPKTPSSLTISGATTVFSVGSTFAFGGSVTLIYSDLSTKPLSEGEYTIITDAVNMNTAGTYNVVVKFNDGIQASYSISVSSSQPIYSATFEGSQEHRTSGSNRYTGSNAYPVSNVYWTFTYGDVVTTGTPLAGIANANLRVAKNTQDTPVAESANLKIGTKQVTKVTFLCKMASGLNMILQYSTGSSWITVETVKDSTVDPTYGYSAVIPNVTASEFELKFSWTVSSTSSSNRDVQLDNIIVYGE